MLSRNSLAILTFHYSRGQRRIESWARRIWKNINDEVKREKFKRKDKLNWNKKRFFFLNPVWKCYLQKG